MLDATKSMVCFALLHCSLAGGTHRIALHLIATLGAARYVLLMTEVYIDSTSWYRYSKSKTGEKRDRE